MQSDSVVRQNIIANFSGKAWATVFNLAFVPVYINLLGVKVYGLLGVLMSMTALLSLLDMGITATLSRELSKSSAEDSGREPRNLVRTFEIVYWAIGILIGVAVAALAPLLAKYWINSNGVTVDGVEHTLRIMGISIALQWPGSLYAGGLMGLQRQVELNIVRSVMVAVQHVGATIVLLFVARSMVAFFLWQAFVGLVSTASFAVCLWKALPPSMTEATFDRRLLFEGRAFALGVSGITIATIILTQVDKVILSKMLTLEMFGYYMLAYNVANALHNLVTPISGALLPKFTQLVAIGDRDKLALLYHQGCQLLSVLVLPVSTTLALFPKEVLSLWLGDANTPQHTYQILSLLMIGTALNALMTLPYTLQLAHGWTKLAFYKNVVAAILLVPLMIWLVHMYQGVGAAWAWIILNLGYLLSEVPIMHKRLLQTEMGPWYKRDIIQPILIVMTIGLLSRIVMPVDPSKFVMLSVILSALVASFATSAFASDSLYPRMLKFKPL